MFTRSLTVYELHELSGQFSKMSKCVVEYFEILHRTFFHFRNGFSTRQSFGKAIKKAKYALPKDFNRRKKVIQALAQAVGIVPQNNHQRTTR